MKSALWKDNLREIKKSFPRFLSILLMLTLGVAFYVGIRSTGPSMLKTARHYYEAYNLPDGYIVSTYGLNKNDIDFINEETDANWLAMKSVQAIVEPSEERAKVFTYQKGDKHFFHVEEGHLPERKDEIVLDSKYVEMLNESLNKPIKIGDRIKLKKTSDSSRENETEESIQAPELTQTEFKVVGFANTPLYFSRVSRGYGEQTVFAIVNNQAVKGDVYSEAYFWMGSTKDSSAYTDEYDKKLKAFVNELDYKLGNQAEVRLNSLKEDLQLKLDNGRLEIDKGYKQLEDGKNALADARAKLDQAILEYNAGRSKLDEGYRSYEEGKLGYQYGLEQLLAGKRKLEDSRQLLLDQEQVYQRGIIAYQEGRNQFYQETGNAQSQITQALEKLNQQENVLAHSKMELEEGKIKLAEGQSQLNLATQQMSQSLKEQQLTPEYVLSLVSYQLNESKTILNQLQNQEVSQGEIVKKQIEELKTKIKSLEDQKTKLTSLIEKVNKKELDSDQVQRQLENISPDIISELRQSDTSLDILYASIIKQINENETALINAQNQLNQLQNSPTDQINKLTSQLTQLNQKISELENQVNINQEKVTEIQSKMNDQELDLKNKEKELKENQDELDNLVNKLAQWQQENEANHTNLTQSNPSQSIQMESRTVMENQVRTVIDPDTQEETQITEQVPVEIQLPVENESIESEQATSLQITRESSVVHSDEEIQVLKGKIEALKNKCQNLEDSVKKEKEKLSELNIQLSQIQQNLTNNQAQLTSASSQRTELLTMIQQLEYASTTEGKEELIQRIQTLSDQLETLKNKRSQLQESKKTLELNQLNLNQQREVLDKGWQEYEQGLNQLNQAKESLNQAQAEFDLNSQVGSKTLSQKLSELESGRHQLDQGYLQLSAGESQWLDSQNQLNQAQIQLAQATQELAEGEARAQEGLDKLKVGESEYQKNADKFDKESKEALKKLKTEEEKLNKNQEKVNELDLPEYYVFQRKDFDSYTSIKNNSVQIGTISTIFTVFFFAIALLVTFTTIQRMANEQRSYMGTMKQLGYPNKRIILKFVTYAGIAGITGIILGTILGYAIFPNVIIDAYNSIYYYGKPQVAYSVVDILSASMIAISCAVAPALIVPYGLLKEPASQLLRPEPPRSGKETLLEKVTWLWKRLSFQRKLTIRNIVRYKGRNLMTLIGVAGCTTLIVTGFGISDTVSNLIDTQFNSILKYDSVVHLIKDTKKEDEDRMAKLMSKIGVKEAYPVYQDEYSVASKKSDIKETVNIVVPLGEIKQLNQFISVHKRGEQVPINLEENQAVITERLAERLNASQGTIIQIEDKNRNWHNVKVTAICENYVGHYIYLSSKTYESLFNEAPKLNSYFAKYDKGVIDSDLEYELSQDKAVQSIVTLKSVSELTDNSIESIELITVILIASAAGLAFIVLYNLTNINIEERIRELSTIKVLGFYSYEVTLYIFAEILILTFIGSVIGLGLGRLLTQYIMKTMQLEYLLFYPVVHWDSYVISFVMTFVFSAIVMLIMHRRIRNIDMVEALKAVE